MDTMYVTAVGSKRPVTTCLIVFVFFWCALFNHFAVQFLWSRRRWKLLQGIESCTFGSKLYQTDEERRGFFRYLFAAANDFSARYDEAEKKKASGRCGWIQLHKGC